MLLKVCSCVMAMLLVSMPCLTLAEQTTDAGQAIIDAERDAKNINANEFFFFGFLAGAGTMCVGVIHLYWQINMSQPPIPTSKLLGKSPEYIAQYTETYRYHVKKIQREKVASGVCAGALCTAGLTILYLRFFGTP